jgi:hypothetical protein
MKSFNDCFATHLPVALQNLVNTIRLSEFALNNFQVGGFKCLVKYTQTMPCLIDSLLGPYLGHRHEF